MDLLKEAGIVRMDDGLIVERVCASQANIFVNDRAYIIHEDELRGLADEIFNQTGGSVTMDYGEFPRGRIVLVWNLTRAMRSDVLAGAVAFICRAIARTHIART